jgi:hypothetical protein
VTNPLIHPVFFGPNRVRRPYVGGSLLSEFLDHHAGEDDHYPEDWLASLLPADDAEEGYATVMDEHGRLVGTFLDTLHRHAESLLGSEHMLVYGPELGFAARLMDPAEPFLIEGQEQTEAWCVLRTREDQIGQPAFAAGLRGEASPDGVDQARAEGELSLVTEMLQPVTAQPGEAFLLPAGLPRCLLPGSLTLRVEPTLAGNPEAEPHAEATGPVRIEPNALRRSDEGQVSELISPLMTTGWAMHRLDVLGRMQYQPDTPFAMHLCIEGEGRMSWPAGTVELSAGRVFLQPFGVPWLEFLAYGRVSLLTLLPPATL